MPASRSVLAVLIAAVACGASAAQAGNIAVNASDRNKDALDHLLKSTGATEFEHKIHTKGTPEPLVFDRLGDTTVFCCLHDWMKAYIYVLDTPYFAKTERAGVALIEGLPEGR